MALSITPLGAGDSVGDLVADCVRIIRDSGLPNETNAMFTNIEGSWDDVMEVVRRCIEHVEAAAPRVSIVMKIDHRPGVTDAMAHKVRRVGSIEP